LISSNSIFASAGAASCVIGIGVCGASLDSGIAELSIWSLSDPVGCGAGFASEAMLYQLSQKIRDHRIHVSGLPETDNRLFFIVPLDTVLRFCFESHDFLVGSTRPSVCRLPVSKISRWGEIGLGSAWSPCFRRVARSIEHVNNLQSDYV
jgi:hypothetical protein